MEFSFTFKLTTDFLWTGLIIRQVVTIKKQEIIFYPFYFLHLLYIMYSVTACEVKPEKMQGSALERGKDD